MDTMRAIGKVFLFFFLLPSMLGAVERCCRIEDIDPKMKDCINCLSHTTPAYFLKDLKVMSIFEFKPQC